jgi:hypothetical protein
MDGRTGRQRETHRKEDATSLVRLTSMRPPCKRVNSLQTKRPRPEPPTAVWTSAEDGEKAGRLAEAYGTKKERERTVPLLEPLEEMSLVLNRHPASPIFDLNVNVAVVASVDKLLGDMRVERRRVVNGF